MTDIEERREMFIRDVVAGNDKAIVSLQALESVEFLQALGKVIKTIADKRIPFDYGRLLEILVAKGYTAKHIVLEEYEYDDEVKVAEMVICDLLHTLAAGNRPLSSWGDVLIGIAAKQQVVQP